MRKNAAHRSSPGVRIAAPTAMLVVFGLGVMISGCTRNATRSPTTMAPARAEHVAADDDCADEEAAEEACESRYGEDARECAVLDAAEDACEDAKGRD